MHQKAERNFQLQQLQTKNQRISSYQKNLIITSFSSNLHLPSIFTPTSMYLLDLKLMLSYISCIILIFNRFVSNLLSNLTRILSLLICLLLLAIILWRMRYLRLFIGSFVQLNEFYNPMIQLRVSFVHLQMIGMSNQFLLSSLDISSFYFYHPLICR